MVPKRLQPYLWSRDTNNLDLKLNKHYIIHQLLAYGRWEDIGWLFKTYGKSRVKEEFINHPAKDYSPAGLNFVSKILLEIDSPVDPQKYDRFTPRIIG